MKRIRNAVAAALVLLFGTATAAFADCAPYLSSGGNDEPWSGEHVATIQVCFSYIIVSGCLADEICIYEGDGRIVLIY